MKRALALSLVPLSLLFGLAWAAGTDDPASRAKKELSDLEVVPSASADTSARHAIDQAKKALARAAELRALHDDARAELAEDSALDWALTARDLLRALDLEAKAEASAAAATSASTKAARARALLDEAVKKRVKLQAEVDEADKALAAQALDAGPPPSASAKKPGKPPKPKGGKP